MADNNAILGTALDEFVGAVLAKKSDKGFLENVDREFVESEVRTLKEALKKYEEMAGRMVEEKGELLGELDRQKDNQKEIFQYLNGELAKKTDEIVALEERLAEKTDELESLLRDHGHAIQEQKDASDHEAVRLKGEIAEYREKLEKVSRFIEIKETLEAQLTEKERLLEEEAKEHATHVSDLERKHVDLIKAYGNDLKDVQEIFTSMKEISAEGKYLQRDGPPLYVNMPPVSGALFWTRGLVERIEEPMAKLKATMR